MEQQTQRIDEIDKYFQPISRMGRAIGVLFWIIAAISLFMPYAASVLGSVSHDTLTAVFIVLVLVHFMLSQVSRFYLVPRAERMRRKQLLSDAFGTRLTHDRTSLYYNNEYSPSVERLGASIMENALFSKETAAKMLVLKRWIGGSYIVVWIFVFALRHNNIEMLTWITQVVFSGEIIAGWLKLECLRFRHERTFDQLHAHFLHGIGADEPPARANILDAFVAYESAKASAGILISTKVFNKLNPSLTERWEKIKEDLRMLSQSDSRATGKEPRSEE